MNTPLSWVKAFVPELSCTAQEYADAMTLSGTKVEGFEHLDKNLDKILVGKIIKIEGHPDADKLIVCQVQISEEGETVQIVTGAANVKEGDKVPVVLEGGQVAASAHHTGELSQKPHPEGIKIKKGKLRGVESFGMLCSIEELGQSREMYPDAPEDGIYILSNNETYKEAKIGMDVPELLGLRDVTFEYEVTSNRVDCFSVLGIAREAAATFRKPFIAPVIKETGNTENVSDMIQVEIKDADLCSRYAARMVKNIKIAPSPEWMQRRLAAAGIRPINNIVDITNYVMEEYGQPMHAFDYDTIAGKKIIVRKGEDGETFTTLDGQVRNIDSTMLMICDGEKPVAIAGIMGGENSKITDDIKTLLLEAACFDGTNIRLSGKKLGMRTDAQAKFEKGLDPNQAKIAIDRACQLIEELGAGEVIGGCVDAYPKVRKPKKVTYDVGKINARLGTNLKEGQMVDYFKILDFEVNEEAKELTIPTWRQDIECLADLAEEVARFYGYDNIPTTLPRAEAIQGKLSDKLTLEKRIRNIAEGHGFSEGISYSFESPKVFDKLLIPPKDELRKTVVISNPLGEDYSIMRTLSLNGMLTSLATNYNRRNKDVRLYEIANIYLPKDSSTELVSTEPAITQLPDERTQLTLGMYGDGDFFHMKGAVENILEHCGLTEIRKYSPDSNKPFLHPGRQGIILYQGEVIGYLGEVHPEVCDNYNIGTKVYVAVLDLKIILEKRNDTKKFKPIGKYPAVNRDISMVMKKSILAGEVEEIIRKSGGKLLERYQLFDIYEGTQIKEGHKSMAYSIQFRAEDRTLEEKEVGTIMEKMVKRLGELGIELRQ